ncbi:MAG: class I SAM-dependent methyltransferase, partial [Symploca sp. SIO2D2]|nr:class I SAM-dependent methyltransferase [Symploca sp. SIO2D2]
MAVEELASSVENAVSVIHPEPDAVETHMNSCSGAGKAVRVGIIARESGCEAREEALDRFPKSRRGEMREKVALASSDSEWRKRLSSIADDYLDVRGVYWLGPFKSFRGSLPYLAGSYEEAGREVASYRKNGYDALITTGFNDAEEFLHIRMTLSASEDYVRFRRKFMKVKNKSLVQKFYDSYGYPFQGVREGSCLNGASYLKIIDFELRSREFADLQILDAGCGSGHRAIEIAKAFPKATVDAFDISASSVDIAREQVSFDGVGNIHFEQSDLLEYNTNKKYDIIISTGVVHHLENPQHGIEVLSRCLRDSGFLVIWLFHQYGEYERVLDRRLIRLLLGEDVEDFELGERLMKGLDKSISSDRFGKSYGDSIEK